jgi:Flp pilus assembly protein TadD
MTTSSTGRSSLLSAAAIIVLALLAGCATAPVTPSPEQADLDEGIALYDRGDYAAAITKLTAVADASTTSTAVQVTAHKYLAFAYCVTNRAALCRTHFTKALTLDPKFDLEASEKGHPLWGPVFDQAKKAR